MDVMLFIVIFMSLVVYTDCCRFGSDPNCAFPCNCERNNCDQNTGDCSGYGGCRSTLPAGYGYGGPGCLVGNIAYGKHSLQSSEYSVNNPASKGNDGKNSCENGHYTHTSNDNPAWYRIDFGGTYYVLNVTVYDRDNGTQRERLIGSKIQILDGTDIQACGTIANSTYAHVLTFACNKKGEAVRIYRAMANSFIHICELVVMGHPYVAKREDCDDWENDIVGCRLCQAGKKLPDCSQDCSSAKYGVNCQHECGNCKTNSSQSSTPCDAGSGICKYGCQDWYIEEQCDTEIFKLPIHNDKISTVVTSSSFVVTWRAEIQPPSGKRNYYHYIIRYRERNKSDMDTPEIPLIDDSASEQPYTVQNLEYNTEYEYFVRSVRTVRGFSDFYDSGVVRVKTSCKAPTAPNDVTLKAEDDSFKVTWDKRNLDSGCDSMTIKIGYKFVETDDWQYKTVADHTLEEHVIGANGSKKCWVVITVVNNQEMETSTREVTETLTPETITTSPAQPDTDEPGVASSSPKNTNPDPGAIKSTQEPANVGMIAGVAVAAVVFVILLVIVVLLFTRYRRSLPAFGKKKDKESKQKLSIDVKFETGKSVTPMGDVHIMPGPAPPSSPKPKPISPRPQPAAKPVVQVNTSIPVSQLGSYISKKRKERDGFKNEYATLPEDETAPCERGSLPENKTKNRFLNIRAYDHSRVILETENDDPFSDYINCNYIPSFDGNKEHYIAGQGPKPHNIVDLWRMIWQKKINRIAMMTNEIENSRRKCDRYWPENVEGSQQYGAITVTTMGIERFPFYTIRLLRVQKDGVSRSVRHFHFTAWIDKRIPEYAFPLLGFRKKVRMYDKQSTGPLFVHCSAGVGRTGTFIAIDYLLEQAKHKHTIDVRKWVNTMRGCRINMIQTLEQYIFVYDTLLEALACGDTSIPASELETTLKQLKVKQKAEKISPLEAQYKVIDDFRPVPKGEDFKALSEDNIHKNRDPNIYPSDLARPYLLTKSENGNDYINAVFVHGYNRSNHYLITQMPLPTTAVDFWRMVCDIDIVTIVALNEINDEDCTPYWPDENDSTETYGPIEVAFKSSKDDEIASVSTFEITNNENGGRKKEVEHIRMMNWPDNTLPDPKNLIHIVNLLEQRAQLHNEGNVVIHCLKGVSNSGILVAALNMIEKLKIDQEIDVFTAVKAIRINRNMFIESFEQYEYLYQVAQTYKAMNDTYANFS